ncbi:hypothetical protein PC116_g10207 [Phytophthora cactorum]|nr:hypothetical protein PC111_g16415 [Phytophthora cactorum]KAG2831583.1 hypothetical protein PC112_g7216 [Phytophthora cactorum]KAG3028546.1 hypothetical protein PC119_g6963 [Phytophthora cactorum]KAG3053543.1 hypothetical protein PC121_g16752 [Phytophthora cactorum]KAG4048519.1 hypothetical protein PC123_g16175 [Phytophthora cactorum]
MLQSIRVSEPDLQHVAHWSEAVVSAVSLQMQIYIPVCKMISTDLIKEPAGIFMYVAVWDIGNMIGLQGRAMLALV